jgi:hypothetical protein
MRQTSGIIINNDIFINSSHVVKIDKSKIEETTYTIEIYMTNEDAPISLHFEKERERDVIFNKIVMELYGHNYAIVDFKVKN